MDQGSALNVPAHRQVHVFLQQPSPQPDAPAAVAPRLGEGWEAAQQAEVRRQGELEVALQHQMVLQKRLQEQLEVGHELASVLVDSWCG